MNKKEGIYLKDIEEIDNLTLKRRIVTDIMMDVHKHRLLIKKQYEDYLDKLKRSFEDKIDNYLDLKLQDDYLLGKIEDFMKREREIVIQEIDKTINKIVDRALNKIIKRIRLESHSGFLLDIIEERLDKDFKLALEKIWKELKKEGVKNGRGSDTKDRRTV
jgi:hypothetical protein